MNNKLLIVLFISSFLSNSCRSASTPEISLEVLEKAENKDKHFFAEIAANHNLLFLTLRRYQCFVLFGRLDLTKEFVEPSLLRNLLIQGSEKVEGNRKQGYYYDLGASHIGESYAKLRVNVIELSSTDTLSDMKSYEYWIYSVDDKEWKIVQSPYFSAAGSEYVRSIEEKITNDSE